MPDNEIVFESVKAFREFMESSEMKKSIRLNEILKTKVYYWVVWPNDQEN